jgi:hypothetical protein
MDSKRIYFTDRQPHQHRIISSSKNYFENGFVKTKMMHTFAVP